MENALYDFYSLVFSYQKLTRSLRSLIRFLILLNSWIKIVRAHFPWSNLYILNCSWREKVFSFWIRLDLNLRVSKSKCRLRMHSISFSHNKPLISSRFKSYFKLSNTRASYNVCVLITTLNPAQRNHYMRRGALGSSRNRKLLKNSPKIEKPMWISIKTERLQTRISKTLNQSDTLVAPEGYGLNCVISHALAVEETRNQTKAKTALDIKSEN